MASNGVGLEQYDWSKLADGMTRFFEPIDPDSFRTLVHNRARYHGCKARTKLLQHGFMAVSFYVPEDDDE